MTPTPRSVTRADLTQRALARLTMPISVHDPRMPKGRPTQACIHCALEDDHTNACPVPALRALVEAAGELMEREGWVQCALADALRALAGEAVRE